MVYFEKAKRHTSIDRLTPELLRLFIQRVGIGERSGKGSRHAPRSIRIIYRDVGTVDSAMPPGEAEPRIIPPITMDEIQKMPV